MLVRIVNFLCVAAMGAAILANYHISEQTRLATVELKSVDARTADARATATVLEAEWERVAGPARIQALAQAKLGMNDGASLQLSALDLLPRRGDEAPLGNSDVQQASAQAPAAAAALGPTKVSDQSGQ